ncbi:hypothetical protein [Amycolatopsis sp. NPDC004079]|uniref:hypothetical protein n=1 Tax=Amycolatopsis sp. NPDC004079 TaxID=3154549 RepID=UPI0033B1E1B2
MTQSSGGKSCDVVEVRTIKSGRAYRVDLDGDVYFFELDQDETGVFVRTRAHSIGGYFLERFGDELSPSSIRRFITGYWRANDTDRA